MPNSSIVLAGVGAGYPNPGVFYELDFAQGPVAGSSAVRKALIIGNKTTAGSAMNDTVVYGPDTPIPCQTENDVINLFGAGSQIHRAFLMFTAVDQSTTPLYFLAVSPSAGAAATATITLTNNATANGNIRVWVGNQFVDTTITSGDTVTTIAGNIVTSINNQTRWAVTAANVAGVVTLTAKNLGPEGNWLRAQSLISSPGAIATTTSLTANTNFTGGTTPDVNSTALSTILASWYYGIIVCDSDATNIGRVVTQVNNQAQPTTGLRQRVFAGNADTLANAITLATGINAPRCEVIWSNCLDLTPLELAANNCALYMKLESGAAVGVNRMNFSLLPSQPTDAQYWLPQLVGGTNVSGSGGRGGAAASPTPAQITSALNSGLTPIINLVNGQAQLVKRCTSRSLNGSTQDYRTRDAHKVTVCDYWGDDVVATLKNQFGGKSILPDPAVGQPPITGNATSPMLVGNGVKGVTKRYGNAGQWRYPPGATPQAGQDPADVINANTKVQQETNPSTRISVQAGLSPVDILDQVAVLAQQIG